ncbi:MAG: hypothetical protein R2729_02370 [Bryobacteraceae bacterium]
MKLVLLLAAPLLAQQQLDPFLERLSEEAEAFAVTAPKMVAAETLKHSGRKSIPRIRIGKKAVDPPLQLPLVTREIVSEFGYALMDGELHEFRRIVQVDGKKAGNRTRARLELAQGMSSESDRKRKRMLQDFEKLGMIGAATDFSQTILLFRRANLSRYAFRYSARNQIGGDPVSILVFRQKTGDDGARIYHDKEMEVVPLEGEIWFRDSDSLPLRIITRAVTKEYGYDVLHAGETEYRLTRKGTLVPVSVRYTRTQEQTVMTENLFVYTDHQIFVVDTEIKFTAEEPIQ